MGPAWGGGGGGCGRNGVVNRTKERCPSRRWENRWEGKSLT